MSPLRLALLCASGLLLLTPQAAAGGGWWSSIRVDRSTVAVGQRVQLDAVVAFGSAAAARAREPGRFHVYLLEGFDDSRLQRAMSRPRERNWWSLGGAEAIRVGAVAVDVSDTGLGRARAAFTVPELPPATYHLMLCDAGCAEPLADVIPTRGFTVVADPATARMTRRVDRLERRIRDQSRRLAGARADADVAGVAARNARSDLERLERRMSSVADEGRGSPPAPWAYAGWLAAGALAGALALLVLRRRRSPLPQARRDGSRDDGASLPRRHQDAQRTPPRERRQKSSL